MRKHIALILLTCCSLSLSSCVSGVITGANAVYDRNSIEKTASDYYLSMKISQDIGSSSQIPQPNSIGITVFHRIVLLTGQVPNAAAQQAAINVAKNTPNVLRVFNAITIGSTISGASSAVDAWITAKIKTKMIATNGIDPGEIKVVTENRVVYLMGVIPQNQATTATDIASHTDGVKRVITIFYYVVMPKIN